MLACVRSGIEITQPSASRRRSENLNCPLTMLPANFKNSRFFRQKRLLPGAAVRVEGTVVGQFAQKKPGFSEVFAPQLPHRFLLFGACVCPSVNESAANHRRYHPRLDTTPCPLRPIPCPAITRLRLTQFCKCVRLPIREMDFPRLLSHSRWAMRRIVWIATWMLLGHWTLAGELAVAADAAASPPLPFTPQVPKKARDADEAPKWNAGAAQPAAVTNAAPAATALPSVILQGPVAAPSDNPIAAPAAKSNEVPSAERCESNRERRLWRGSRTAASAAIGDEEPASANRAGDAAQRHQREAIGSAKFDSRRGCDGCAADSGRGRSLAADQFGPNQCRRTCTNDRHSAIASCWKRSDPGN